MDTIISLDNISKSFYSNNTKVDALLHVTLEIKKGEVFGLLGPNGAGKTTLIGVLCGFLIPESGKSYVLSYNSVTQLEKLHTKMNLVSGFSGVPNYMTAEQLLKYYSYLYDIKPDKIDEVLAVVGLSDHKKEIVYTFSSGMRQRFLIAKSLLNDPEVIIMDEPTVGLDIDSAANLRETIKDLKKRGVTILLTSHDMREVQELCDRVALIKDGWIINVGTISELKAQYFSHKLIDIKSQFIEEIFSLFKSFKGINNIEKKKGFVRLHIDDTSLVSKLISKLVSSKIDFYEINSLDPELEDIYREVMMK